MKWTILLKLTSTDSFNFFMWLLEKCKLHLQLWLTLFLYSMALLQKQQILLHVLILIPTHTVKFHIIMVFDICNLLSQGSWAWNQIHLYSWVQDQTKPALFHHHLYTNNYAKLCLYMIQQTGKRDLLNDRNVLKLDCGNSYMSRSAIQKLYVNCT